MYIVKPAFKWKLFAEKHRNACFYVDTVKSGNDTVKSENDTVFSLIQQNRNITAIEISERLNLSLSTVKRKIKDLDLKEQGIIERVGSDKTGDWKFFLFFFHFIFMPFQIRRL
jgi:Predicted transcriptional regulator containing an HTH domain and an uncharacterized domain shared with the mammalian protein Schlafen